MRRATRWKLFYPMVRFGGAAAIAVILLRFPFSYLEGALYDARVRWKPNPKNGHQIVTIAIDQKTLSALKGEPDTQDNTTLVEQIRKENPEAVVYIDDPTKWTGTEKERIAFSQAAARTLNFFFATEQVSPMNPYGHLKLPNPFDSISLASAPVTRDNLTFAGDKVTRRILVSFEGQLLLQPVLASLHNHIVDPTQYRGTYEKDGSTFTFMAMKPKGTFAPLSFIDVKEGRIPKNSLANKIVLIGRDTLLDTDDYILTSYSRDPLAMSKLEAQANILSTLIENGGIVRLPSSINLLLTILVAWLTVILVWRARPTTGILLILGQAAGFIILSYVLFAFFGIWVKMVHPLFAIFISYYFFIPYRLISENKKTWEYAQKNKLLTQVEELKTNFISMMSHDLKTPLARIQGMAEMAIRERGSLSPAQKEALQTIIGSSEDLSRFITSILDLSRIEGKDVKLQKSSRDVNAVLKEIMNKYEFSAREKNIVLRANLDPLFSVKMDVELMKQVFSNLVENAIKYGPENSTVTISSKEEANSIKVSVANMGPGIPKDEVDNIFLKFYRSKAAKASPVKGTGLGLYLAKYFVELHGGAIQVQSEPEKGAVFTVELPMLAGS